MCVNVDAYVCYLGSERVEEQLRWEMFFSVTDREMARDISS